MRRRVLLGSAVAAAIVAAGCSENKPSFKSVDVTGAEHAKDFQLPDADGRMRSLKDFKGKIVVLFFGYTQCPDVCPTTLTELVQVKKALGADGDKVQGIFVTVDPERDTSEVLKAYVANFDPSFVALRGSPEAVAAAAKEFRIYFEKVPGKTPTSYTVNHSVASFIYDPEGHLRLYTRPNMGVQALTDDLKILLKG